LSCRVARTKKKKDMNTGGKKKGVAQNRGTGKRIVTNPRGHGKAKKENPGRKKKKAAVKNHTPCLRGGKIQRAEKGELLGLWKRGPDRPARKVRNAEGRSNF